MSRTFHVQSRGDRFRGRATSPQGAGRRPLVIVCGATGAADEPLVDSAFERFGSFAVVAAIDLPLCGARRSAKLSELVFDGTSATAVALRADVEAQAGADLERALEWLGAQGDVDAERVGLVGFGRGGELASAFCERTPGLACAVTDAEPGDLAALDATLRERLGVG